jgi:hypothetical protein
MSSRREAGTERPRNSSRAAALSPSTSNHHNHISEDSGSIRSSRSAIARSPQELLFSAARHGRVEELRSLVMAGADLGVADAKGQSVLHLTAKAGHIQVRLGGSLRFTSGNHVHSDSTWIAAVCSSPPLRASERAVAESGSMFSGCSLTCLCGLTVTRCVGRRCWCCWIWARTCTSETRRAARRCTPPPRRERCAPPWRIDSTLNRVHRAWPLRVAAAQPHRDNRIDRTARKQLGFAATGSGVDTVANAAWWRNERGIQYAVGNAVSD